MEEAIDRQERKERKEKERVEVTSPSSTDEDMEEQAVSKGATPVVGAEVTSPAAADDDREEEARDERIRKLGEEGERIKAVNDRVIASIAMFEAGLIGPEEAWKRLWKTEGGSD